MYIPFDTAFWKPSNEIPRVEYFNRLLVLDKLDWQPSTVKNPGTADKRGLNRQPQGNYPLLSWDKTFMNTDIISSHHASKCYIASR